MILERGSYILVVHRRLFEGDRGRFFVGKVDDYEVAVARVTGHTWVQDNFNGKMLKKEGARTKIFSLASGTLIVYVLPDGLNLSTLRIDYDRGTHLILTDGGNLHLDLSEGLHSETPPTNRKER